MSQSFLVYHQLTNVKLIRCPLRYFKATSKYFNCYPESPTSTHARRLSMDPPNKQQPMKTPTDEIEKFPNPKNVNLLTSDSRRSHIKQAVRDYGATVVVFHVSISLISFGLSYAVVSSGLDVVGLLTWLGVDKSIIESRFATGGTTFVVAYALYKVFVPLRVFCTLTISPFIVRYLWRKGFITPPKSN